MWFRALAGASFVLLSVQAACGDSYEAAEPARDGGAGSDAATPSGLTDAGAEAAPATAACDPRAPFTKVERAPGLPNGAGCTRLTADETTAYFSVENELRIARREGGGPFGVGTKLEKVDPNGSCPTLTADQRVLFYEDYFAIVQQSGSPGGPYSAKSALSGAPAPSGVGAPFLDEPRNQLYAVYHLDPKNYFGNTAIGVSNLTGGSAGPFRRVDVGFGVDGGEGATDAKAPPTYAFTNPVVSADGLAIYFATTRTVDGGTGDLAVWVATRATSDTDFSNPTMLPGLNTKYTESVSWISPDQCRLYFSSDRDNPGVFSVSTFVASRAPTTR